MKKCEKCGKGLKDNAKFCPYCGAAVPQGIENPATKLPITPEMLKNNPKLIAGIAVAAVVLIAIFVLVFSPKSMKITPEEYVTISTYGLNGEGYAEVTFDAESLLAAIKEEKKLKPAQESEIASLLLSAEQYISLSEKSGLSNGDKLVITSSMPSDYLKKYGVSIKNKAAEFVIAGLIEVQNVQLQDYYVAEFKGFNGYGWMNYDVDYDRLYTDVSALVKNADNSQKAEEYIQSTLYAALYHCVSEMNADRIENLSNGEMITLSCTINERAARIEKYGIVFSAEDKTYEVSGLDELLTVNLEEYLTAEIYGYQTVGELDAKLDEEKMAAALRELIPEERNGYTAEYAAERIVSHVSYNIGITADKTENLSNGDEVTLSVAVESDTNFADSMGIILECAEKVITVEGLAEPEEIDLADILTITFSGTCPNIRIDTEVDWKHPVSNYLDWESVNSIPYKMYGANGDIVNVVLEADEEAALKAGYKITNYEVNVEVSGLSTYDISLESVKDGQIAKTAEWWLELGYQKLIDQESSVLNLIGAENVSVRWYDVKMALDKVAKIYAERAYYKVNSIVFVYEYLIPICYQNEFIEWKSVYAAAVFENIVQDAEGTYLFPERENWYRLCNSSEAVEELLLEIENETSREDGSVCERTEIINDEADKILVPSDEEAVKMPESVVFEMPEIPELMVDGSAAVIEYDGHRYYRFDEAVTWAEARTRCEELGGNLASITSWTEQSVITDLIDDGELSSYWVGGTDRRKEGTWIWTDGEPFYYTAWERNQPDNYNEAEHYIQVVRNSSGAWNDEKNECEGVGYIMEVTVPDLAAFTYLSESKRRAGEGYVSYDSCMADSYGNLSYGTLAYNASENGWNQYQLNGRYSRLTGTLSVWEEAASGVSIDFAVFGDGKLLYRQRAIGKQTAPIGVDLDISGVQELTIATRNPGEYSNGFLVFSNAKLYSADTAVSSDIEMDKLSDLTLIDYSGTYEEVTTLWQDAFGELHNGTLCLNASSDTFALWNLDGKYSTFEATIVTGRQTGAAVSMQIQIYGDDELLYECSEFNRTKKAFKIAVDVTGKKTLKVVTDDLNDHYSGYLYICDDVLAYTEKPSEFPSAAVRGDSLSSLDEKLVDGAYYHYYENIADAKGNQYEGTYVLDASNDAWVVYELNGEYSSLSGLMTTYKETEQNADMSVAFFGDGRLLYERGHISGWTDPEAFYVDLTGVETLTIRSLNDGAYAYGWIMMNDTVLEKADEVVESERLTSLSDLQMIDSVYMEDLNRLFVDTYGKMYDGAQSLQATRNAYAVYLLDGSYTEFSGTICAGARTRTGNEMTFQIYGDDKLIFEQTGLSRQTEAVPFIIDVAGVNNLKIAVFSQNDGYDGYLFLVNDGLK